MEIPVIKGEFVKIEGLLGRSNFADVFRGWLAVGRGQVVSVVVKVPTKNATQRVWAGQEASVLHELVGEAGVPRLYGVTASCPPALVMSVCHGQELQKLLERGEVKLCLHALMKICNVVRRLHARGITHGDIHAGNVLVNVLDDGALDVSLLDFGLASKNTSRERQMDDVDQIVAAALKVLPEAKEFSDLRWNLENTFDVDGVSGLLNDAIRKCGKEQLVARQL